jgi:hypothetical protein
LKPFVDPQQLSQAAGQQASHHQQGSAQADFEADEALTEAHSAAPFCDRPASATKRLLWIATGDAPRWKDTKQDSGEHRETTGKHQHAGIEPHFLKAWGCRYRWWPPGVQQPPGKNDSQRMPRSA